METVLLVLLAAVSMPLKASAPTVKGFVSQPDVTAPISPAREKFTNSYRSPMVGYHIRFECGTGITEATVDAALYFPDDGTIPPGMSSTFPITSRNLCVGGVDAAIFADGTAVGVQKELDKMMATRAFVAKKLKDLEKEAAGPKWSPVDSLQHISSGQILTDMTADEKAYHSVLAALRSKLKERLEHLDGLNEKDPDKAKLRNALFLRELQSRQKTLGQTIFPTDHDRWESQDRFRPE
jgi:hypothetical protein